MADIELDDLPVNTGINQTDLLHLKQGNLDVQASVQSFVENSQDLKDLISAEVSSIFRGSVVGTLAIVAPTGWIPLDGTQVLVATVPDLAVWLTANGLVGAGQPFQNDGTNITTPDYRGQFFRVYDPTGSIDVDRGGVGLGLIQGDEFASHIHTIDSYIHSSSNGRISDGGGGGSLADNNSTTAVGGSETRPTNAALNFYMKA